MEKNETTEKIPLLRYYRVFHIDQIEGIPEDKIPKIKSHDLSTLQNVLDEKIKEVEQQIDFSV